MSASDFGNINLNIEISLMNPEEVKTFIQNLLHNNDSMAQLSSNKVDYITSIVLASENFAPPFRQGRSNEHAVLDSQGLLVHHFSLKRNGKTKSKILVEALNYFYRH